MIHIIFFLIWDQLFESPGNRKASLRKRRLMFVTQILLYEGASQHATKNRIDQETWAIWGDALKWYTEYVVLYRVTSHDLPWKNTDYGCLPFTWEIQKFWLENQMALAIPFGELQKIWAVVWGIQYFSTLLVCSADSDTDIVMGSSFHHVKFHSFMFMHKIFTQAICVNGKHLRYNPASGSWRELACAKLSSHPVGWLPYKSDEDARRKIEIKTLRETNLCLGKNITIFSPFPQTESPFTGYLKPDIVASCTSLSGTWIRKYSDFQS